MDADVETNGGVNIVSMRTPNSLVVSVALAAVLGLSACAPATTPTPQPTRLDITTLQVICGGVVPPPGEPFCRTYPSSRTVAVGSPRQTVATGTSGADGKLLIEVPVGTWQITIPDAMTYENCDAPLVTAIAAQTTAVTQTCTINAP